MKRYFAELIELALATLCALTNHAGGCWLLNNTPLGRLYNWSLEARRAWDPITKIEHVLDTPCTCNSTITVGTVAASSTWLFCAKCNGMRQTA